MYSHLQHTGRRLEDNDEMLGRKKKKKTGEAFKCTTLAKDLNIGWKVLMCISQSLEAKNGDTSTLWGGGEGERGGGT